MPDLLSILGATPAKGGTTDVTRLSGMITPLKNGLFSSVLQSLADADLQAGSGFPTTIGQADGSGESAVADDAEGADPDVSESGEAALEAESEEFLAEDAASRMEQPTSEEIRDDERADMPVPVEADDETRAAPGVVSDDPPEPVIAWSPGLHPIEAALRGALQPEMASVVRRFAAETPAHPAIAVKTPTLMAGESSMPVPADPVNRPIQASASSEPGLVSTGSQPDIRPATLISGPVPSGMTGDIGVGQNRAIPAGSAMLTPHADPKPAAPVTVEADSTPAVPRSEAQQVPTVDKREVVAQPGPTTAPAAPVQKNVVSETTQVRQSAEPVVDHVQVGSTPPAAPVKESPLASAPVQPVPMRQPVRGDAERPDRERSTEAGRTREVQPSAPVPPRVSVSAVQQPQPTVQGVPGLESLPGPASIEAGLEPSVIQAAESSPTRGFDVTSSAQPAAMARPELAREIGRQLAPSIMAAADGSIDIALSPKELGHVRMSLSITETGVTLMVSGERPETVDLMRRHSEELSAAFREMGYENIAFSFGGGGDAGTAQGSMDQSGIAVSSEPGEQSSGTGGEGRDPGGSRGLTPDGGLDIRI